MLRTLVEKVDPQHTAVIVVDVQNDFCAPQGGLAALGVDMSMIDACVPRIQRLVAAAREAGARVIHIRSHHHVASSRAPIWSCACAARRIGRAGVNRAPGAPSSMRYCRETKSW